MEYKGYKLRKAMGYWVLCLNLSKTIYLHRYVWEEVNGPIPEGMLIHHVDGDKLNNEIENLELVSHKDHRRIHAGWLRDDKGWTHKPCPVCGMRPLSEFYKQGKGYQSKCKPCMTLVNEEYARNNAEKIRATGLKSYHRNKHKKSLTSVQEGILALMDDHPLVFKDRRYRLNGEVISKTIVNILIKKGLIDESLHRVRQ